MSSDNAGGNIGGVSYACILFPLKILIRRGRLPL